MRRENLILQPRLPSRSPATRTLLVWLKVMSMTPEAPATPVSPEKNENVAAEKPLPRVRSSDLLQGERELLIEHEGELYRLRLTRYGKLILHK